MISIGGIYMKYLDNVVLKFFIKLSILMLIFVLGLGFLLNIYDWKFVIKKLYIKFNLCIYYICILFKVFVNN